MSTSQRARSGVPLDQRSALASVPGVPAWGAVAIAVGASFLGFVIDAARGTELTIAFACFYIIGVVAAAVLVRYRGLFTAMVQAPLILFAAVPLSYQYFTENPGTSLKDILLNVAIPLVNRFPLMLLATLLAVAIGAARVFLKRQASHTPASSGKRSVRERAKDTRDRAQENRAKSQKNRAKAKQTRVRAAESQPRRATTEPRAGATQSRAAHSRTADPAPRSRRADRLDAPDGRRARRERAEPQFDRPSADPYRADRRAASEPPRRQAPRPQTPRVPRPPEVDPYSAPRGSTPSSVAPASTHIPPHPVPQVRYRDRGDA
ncbi:hypothetical protein QMK17_02825 [Rhodococcus sp. G-MC3]|uniref:DUF6542 domain-containing protein n=1 Tax=Rhodococcus sp. G-MC3 TaxID=3046209 RepID=UPI0024B9E120|nr:DUF6542 domain-containing protein [Rhodococcus sp. G-MC3]MDJ0392265.1 hypothetical protein [Rhodococcus sp. G-MC3]